MPTWFFNSGSGGVSNDAFNYAAANNPADSLFTLIQNTDAGGTGTMSNLATGRGFVLTMPNNNSNDCIGYASRAVPAGSSWSITTMLNANIPTTKNNGNGFGIFVSDGTKYQNFGWDEYAQGNGPAWGSVNWSTIDTYGSRSSGLGSLIQGYALVWLRLTYTAGGDFILYVSNDGETWTKQLSIGVTDFLGTPTTCGLFLDCSVSNTSPAIVTNLTCLSYQQG